MISGRLARGTAAAVMAVLMGGLPAAGAGCTKRSEPAAASEDKGAVTTAEVSQAPMGASPVLEAPPPPAAPAATAPAEALKGDSAQASRAPAKKAFAPRAMGEEGGRGPGAPRARGSLFDASPAAPSPAPSAAGAPPSSPAPSPAAAETAIDPNGRFATTYRPGGGHLAAFESAVARGIIPAAEREIVSDVGARYAPQVAPPKGKALTVATDIERGKLPSNGGPTHLRLLVRSTDAAPAARPHLSVHLVLDVSGSMKGDSIQRAREAARALVDKLAPTDDFSLVTFSSDAEVKVPDGPVGPRRDHIKKVIADIVEGGGTNIGRGLELGYAQAQTRSIPADAVRVVLLLSDGRANAGVVNSERLSQMALGAFQQGVQTSSFGLGADYDGDLMSSIAGDGAGGYYYLRDPEQITPALATELDKRLDPVATAVEVRVRLRPGISLLKVYGSRRLSEAEAARVRSVEVAADQHAQKRDGIKADRQDDLAGGMRFFIPAFARDDSHALLLKVSAPPGVGNRALALVELKYKDRVTKKNVTEELPITIPYAHSDSESAASVDPSVARTVQGFAAGETLADAATRIARNDRVTAMVILSEREGILRTAAETLHEPLFLKDADRLARLREHAGGTTGMGDPLVLAMLLETAARTHMR